MYSEQSTALLPPPPPCLPPPLPPRRNPTPNIPLPPRLPNFLHPPLRDVPAAQRPRHPRKTPARLLLSPHRSPNPSFLPPLQIHATQRFALALPRMQGRPSRSARRLLRRERLYPAQPCIAIPDDAHEAGPQLGTGESVGEDQARVARLRVRQRISRRGQQRM